MAEKEQKQLEQILKHRKKYVLRKDSTRRSLDVNKDTIKDLYDFENYEVKDFLQSRSMNQNLSDYKNENDLVVQLATKAKADGQKVKIGSTFYYYKTNGGVELEGNVESIDDIDIKYHWNIVSNLLQKFNLTQWVNKKPLLTVMDRKQQSLLEFV